MTQIEQIRQEIERRIKELDEQIIDIYDSKAVLRKNELQRLLSFLDTLKKPENPKDLQSLINEASETAQRIIDRHSFYASLPENLRHKYTEGSWLEILDAISKYGKQEPEVGLEEEIENYFDDRQLYDTQSQPSMEEIARHFFNLGRDGRPD